MSLIGLEPTRFKLSKLKFYVSLTKVAYWLVKRGLLQRKRWSFGMRKAVFCFCTGFWLACRLGDSVLSMVVPVMGGDCRACRWCGRLLSLFAYLVYPFGDVFEDFGRDGFFYLSVFDGEAGGACLEQVVEAGVGLYGV